MFKSVRRHKINAFAVAFALLFPLFAFQNCYTLSSSNFNLSNGLFKSFAGGGNGEGYDGKLVDHIRIVPGVVCSNQSIAIGRIQIGPNSAMVKDLRNACGNESREVTLTSLTRSEFSSSFIGFEGAVYTSYDNNNLAIEDPTFTEAWCRGRLKGIEEKNIEIAVRWTESGRLAQMAVLDDTHRALDWKPVTRDLQLGQVIYQKDSSSLTVSLLNRDPVTQEIKGGYKQWSSSALETASMNCYMGGQFDFEAPSFTYPNLGNKTLAIGEDVGTNFPEFNKLPETFRINQELPSGIVFNSATGSIEGQAQAMTSRKNYSVTAVFKFGEIDYQFSLGVGSIQVVDQNSAGVGDVACTNPAGACSLGGAVARANLNPLVPLIVELQPALTVLDGRELVLNGDLTIRGINQQSEISGFNKSRIFKLLPNAYLGLDHVKVSNGRAQYGGCIYSVKNRIQINNSSFSDCVADNGIIGDVEPSRGGAIYMASGYLDINNTEFNHNRTKIGRYEYQGGAVYISVGTHKIRGTKFNSNSSGSGGAIWAENLFSGHLNIEDCEFTKNTANVGGGLATRFNGDFSIANSAFDNNVAIWSGAALWSSDTELGAVSKTKFINNQTSTTEQSESIVYWSGRSFFLFDSIFQNNLAAPGSEGALFYNHSGLSYVKNSSFVNNEKMVGCKVPQWANSYPGIQIISLGGNVGCD